jgi:transforming growth factor-beta-induced protein
MKHTRFYALALVATLALAACQPPAPAAPAAEAPAAEAEATEAPTEEAAAEAPAEGAAEGATADIVDTAIAAGNFTTLVAAVEAAGLVETLKGEGPFTVFAPTDEAFAALPAGTLDTLLADPSGDLTQILLYHVVPGAVMAADVTDSLEATTVQGSPVTFTAGADGVMINDATIVTTDIAASNGVIHVIDAVLLPPAEGEMGAGEAMTGTETMTETEAMTDTAAAPAAGAAEGATADIVDTAIAAGNFTTLVTAVEAAGLVETLKGEGPFTVFAPTDEAFAALPAGTLDTLLADPSGALSNVLLYHVVPGQVMAADVAGLNGQTVETVGGQPLTITVDGDMVMINDATVVTADIVTSNGVIHVIDTVLVPAE